MKQIIAAAIFAVLVLLVAFNKGAAQAPPAATVDTDGDGIPDYYETHGIDIVYPGGTSQHLNLSSSPLHKDVFVFYAWMAVPGGHSHKPVPNTDKLPDGSPIDSQPLGRVIDAFAKSPVRNPDNVDGITLHLIPVQAPEITETASLAMLGDVSGQGAYDWTAYYALRKQLFPALPAAVASAFHFCLFAHQLGGNGLAYTSGISNGIPANDFIVSLGSGENQIGTPDDQVGTFMHELGHNLGLHHGGVDDINNKPNYPSVMNYMFQFIGTLQNGAAGVFDYSRIGIDLDEAALNDAHGITTDPAASRFGSAHLCSADGTSQAIIPSFTQPVRWEDCEDSPAPDRVFAFDVNRDNAISLMKGQNDWASAFPSAVASTGMKPGDEPSSLSGAQQTLFIQPSIDARRNGADVQLKWTQIPLKRVQGYQLLRQTAGGPPQPLVITKKTTYQDSGTPLDTSLAYEVRPIVAIPSARPAGFAAAAAPQSLPRRALFGAGAVERVAYGKTSRAAIVPPAAH